MSTRNKACPLHSQQMKWKISVYISTAIFPGEPGLASFIEAKDDRSGGDNWSYKTCKTPVKIQTNQHPPFYRPDALPVNEPTSKHWMENITVHGLLTTLTALGDGCHASHQPSDANTPRWNENWWWEMVTSEDTEPTAESNRHRQQVPLRSSCTVSLLLPTKLSLLTAAQPDSGSASITHAYIRTCSACL